MTFDALKKLLRAGSAPLDKLTAGLAEAEQAERTAAAAIVDLDAVCADDILEDDAKRRANRQKLAEARDRRDDATAIATRLQARLAEAEHAAEQDRRVATYEAAKRQASAPFARDYDSACRALLKVVRNMAEARIAVAAANTALPAGAERLLDPEHAIITIEAGQPRRVISEKEVDVWCFAGSWTPIGDQSRVCVDERNKAKGYVPAAAVKTAGNIDVELRTFLRRETLPETFARWSDPIGSLVLPGFVSRTFNGPDGVDPDALIAAIDVGLAMRDRKPAERKPVIELVPVSADGEIMENAA